MSVEIDVRPDQGTDQEGAFLDLFDPRFQPDARRSTPPARRVGTRALRWAMRSSATRR
jgi:hypothetical protein